MHIRLSIVSVFFILACHTQRKLSDGDTQNVSIIAAYDSLTGEEIIAKSDCLTCHKKDERIVGPSYVQVAYRYANMPDTIVSNLAKKLISGGKGSWGEIFMTPHPGFSQANAEAVIKFILSLKNK